MTSPRARFAMPLLSLALGFSALIAFAGVAQPVAHGQSETVTPAALVLAAQADLAERSGAPPTAIALLRAEAVTWNDGCLGAAAPAEVCTQALVDGFVLWLSDGDAAHRYHTGGIGNVVRLAASGIPSDIVQEAPLPAGATPRAGAAATVEGFLSLLSGAGFDEILVQEIGVLRDWIPGVVSPHYIVGGATIEIFQTASNAEASAALANLDAFGGGASLGEDGALWRFDALLIVLLSASAQPEMQATITGLIGGPLLTTAPAPAQDQPDPAALETSVSAVIDALQRAGISAVRLEIVVNRPFLPGNALSAVLSAGGRSIELFALADPAAVDTALRDLTADADLSAGLVVWRRGSTLVVLRGDDPALSVAISAVLEAPAFVGEVVAVPTPPPPLPDEVPIALPASGNGGLAEAEDGTPAWVWGVIGAVAAVAVSTGAAYRFWLRGRTAAD